ncbi:hypothetical protein [Chitinophaga cymbidii]|uniref:Uncharacterized protein n=1 Tax=Chitinophaga cymbidii TaxID=1096750 RepID=A0A512RDM2_9BACT|nr:hypothetical protein [Chitinophaga cymbidii]GEP93806.1 hypothetical protein CCY01nite_00660 [Chitinophaga cymbidii]
MRVEHRRLFRLNIIFKALAGYQVLGGMLGFGMLAWSYAGANRFDPLLLLIVAVLYGFSVCCGVLILKKPVAGLHYSFIHQLLQTVHIGWHGYVFKYISGLALSLSWSPFSGSAFSLQAELSRFNISVSGAGGGAFIGINLLAIFLSGYLLYVRESYSEALLAKEITHITDISEN